MAEPIPEIEPIEPIKNRKQPAWTLWLAAGGLVIFLCATVFLGILVLAGPNFMEKILPDSIRPADELKREITQSNTMGDPDAPIHMIEYGDFQ